MYLKVSEILKGKQMADVLNLCHITAACAGNHDFDFGVDTLDDLVKRSNYPWLLSNITNALTNETLAGTQLKHIITTHNGVKVFILQ